MCWVPAYVNSFQSRRIILSRVAQLFNFCLTRGERSSFASTGSLNCVRSVVSVGFLLRTTFIFFFCQEELFFFLYSFVSWSFLFLGLYQTFSLLLSGKSSFLIKHFPLFHREGPLPWFSLCLRRHSVCICNICKYAVNVSPFNNYTYCHSWDGEFLTSLPNPGILLTWEIFTTNPGVPLSWA